MIWVEILGRHGVVRRVRATSLPIVIGRGYDADVLLDDPHVDARHLRVALAPDGALMVEDLGSVNGTGVGDGAGRGGRLLRGALAPLPADGLLRLGQTLVRVVPADRPVPPAVPEPAGDGRLLRLLTAPRAVVLVPLAGLAVSALDLWLGDAKGRAADALITDALGLLLVVAAWAGVWALAGRGSGRRPRFGSHHALAWAFLIAVGATTTLFAWADFLFASRVAAAVGAAASAALTVALLSGHLALATGMRRARRLVVALLVVGGLSGAAVLIARADRQENGANIAIPATLEPLPAGLVPAEPVEGFLERARGVQRRVDRRASQEVRRLRSGSRSGP